MKEKIVKIQHPATWIPSLYFAMGLPFALLSMTSVLMYKDLGVSDSKITFWTGLIILPWTLKPLWSPVLEMFKTKKYFVLITQFLAGLVFVLIAFSLHLDQFFSISILLFFVIAFCGATHDIAADGIYLTSLSPSLQSKYIGWQGAAYNIAKFLSMSGFAFLAGKLTTSLGPVNGWMWAFVACGILMLLLVFYHTRMLPGEEKSTSDVTTLKEGLDTLWDVLKTFFQRKLIVWHICFIILYRFAEGLALKIVPLFLKTSIAKGGLGLDTTTVASVYGAGSISFVLGSLLAGYYLSKRGLKRSLMHVALAFNVPFVCYYLLSLFRPENIVWVYSSVLVEWLGYGFGFAGLTLFMMQQISTGKYKMAHYAFATAIMNLGVMIPSMISGYLSDMMGYNKYFLIVLIGTIPALLVCKYVPFLDKEN